MEAMIFAAGLGTRMGALTRDMPKALVPVRGRPLLGHVMDRLVTAGVTRIVVNTSHHAAQVEAWLRTYTPPATSVQRPAIAISPEPDGPYDTGGGLVAAAPHFVGDGPIILHNVDILSRIDLGALVAAHRVARERNARVIATIAVQDRATSRKLRFDDAGLLGWVRAATGQERVVRQAEGPVHAFGFSGIHVIEPALPRLTERTGVFSILDLYLDLAERGHVIMPHDVTASSWLDVGTPERLAAAEAFTG